MIPKKQRIAIATEVGWSFPHGHGIPDYLNSVDAMLTAVQSLTPRQRKVFGYLMEAETIGDHTGRIPDGKIDYREISCDNLFECLTSRPSTWAKCFLRAAGKWEGE